MFTEIESQLCPKVSPLRSGETFSLPWGGSLRMSLIESYGVTSKPIVVKQLSSGYVCGVSDKLQLR